MKRLDILKALRDRVHFFENNKILKARALYNYYYQLCYQKKMMLQHFPKEEDIISKITKEIKEVKKDFFTNIYINPLRKLKILIKF